MIGAHNQGGHNHHLVPGVDPPNRGNGQDQAKRVRSAARVFQGLEPARSITKAATPATRAPPAAAAMLTIDSVVRLAPLACRT